MPEKDFRLPANKLKTMIFDSGKGFVGFNELEKSLLMRSFLANPYHSWEHGTNENTSGL
jgi:IS30 family transposase